ncbi:LysE family translocator [Brevibacterium metallidurans]|uniref:LysE family translocator n=1 Tax=Brevibacterium metallidurans TaxID=1482676 RepID=A0ABN0SIQ6_9MICO
MSMEFWVTSIVATATPGTGALFTIAAALSRGPRAGLIAALGCALGILPHLILALTGAAALLAASPIAFQVLKWLGVAYLLYVAWGMWRGSGALDTADTADSAPAAPAGTSPASTAPAGTAPAGTGAAPASAIAVDRVPRVDAPLRIIRQAVLVNLLNPKLTLFFLVFLPMFVDPTGSDTLGLMAGLGLIFMGLTFGIFAVYGFAAGWLRRFVIGRPAVMRGIDIGFALTFVGLAAMLALTQQ